MPPYPDTISNWIHSRCYKRLSRAEDQYLHSCRARTYQYIACQSSSELILQFAINCASANLNVLDYLYIFTYIASIGLDRPKDGKINPVDMLLDVIDNYDLFDQVMKNSKFIKLLVNTLYPLNEDDSVYAYRILAHVFRKFPDWLKANFMQYKLKGKMHTVFSQEDVDKYF